MLARAVVWAGNLPHGINQERILKFIQETVSQAFVHASFLTFNEPLQTVSNPSFKVLPSRIIVCEPDAMRHALMCARLGSCAGSHATCVHRD